MLNNKQGLFIGLMSGTSIDAVDAVLVSISNEIEIIASHSLPIPLSIKQKILTLCQSGPNELEQFGRLDRTLGKLFAKCTQELCDKASIHRSQVTAVGSHGQTIRHMPDGPDGYSLQIADPNTIAELTGITTIADFRRRDVAAGGQGAPLVPAFHDIVFRQNDRSRAIVNIGGISNITLLPKGDSQPTGFDTGPGNMLLDHWVQHCKALAYDENGDWAASGELCDELLSQMLNEPYLQTPPPKSTGRELFGAEWLNNQLSNFKHLPNNDVQNTIAEFTALTIANGIRYCEQKLLPTTHDSVGEIYICGGGARNGYVMQRLAALLPNKLIDTTAALGIDPDLVEAVAFAWLAYRTTLELNGSLASVTGATGDRILGGIYPGGIVNKD